jgi:hypothetical protein
LSIAHNPDGTLMSSALTQAGMVTQVNTKTPVSGIVTLTAGDLSAYTKPVGGIPSSDLAAATQTALNKAATSVQSVNSKTPVSGAVTLTASDVGAPTSLAQLSDVSGVGSATPGQVLAYSGTAWAPATASGSASDATAGAKGIVQLAGDLSGTAAAPTVPGLSTKVSKAGDTMTGTLVVPSLQLTGGTLANGNVLVSDANGNAAWGVPSNQSMTPPPITVLGNVSGAVAVNLSLLDGAGRGVYTLTQTGNITLSFTNVPATAISFEIWATQGGSGGYSISSSLTWLGGTFTPITTFGALNIIPIESINGSTLYAFAS